MQIIERIKNRCAGCARLQDAKAKQSALRMEKSQITRDYQDLSNKYLAISETNRTLGKELERKVNELRAAKTEIAHSRKHLEQMKNALKERNTEYTNAWKRIRALESQNAKLIQKPHIQKEDAS